MEDDPARQLTRIERKVDALIAALMVLGVAIGGPFAGMLIAENWGLAPALAYPVACVGMALLIGLVVRSNTDS